MPVVKDIAFKISREEVLKILRHDKKNTVLTERVNTLLNQTIDAGRGLAEPKAVYRDFWIKSTHENTVVLDGTKFDLLGKSIVHHLWDSEGVTLFAVTLGPKIDKKIKEFSDSGNMSTAVILDAIGSVIVDSAADYVNDLANKRARDKGYKTVKRYSPGYGDWHLKEQKGMIQVLKASRIGIRLSSNYQMYPQKSITAVIGWKK